MTDIATTSNARIRAERIRLGMHSYIATRRDIADAYRDRDWQALGYDSWETYVDGEFSESRVRLSAPERREAVAELRLAGMSQRAIGTTLGVSKATVANDLAEVVNSDHLPEAVTGADGKTYAATRPTTETPGSADPVSTVAAALDKYVPDPGAEERAWRKTFYDQIRGPHKFLLWADAGTAAQHADNQDIETLRLLAEGYADLHRRVLAERNGNVRSLRRVQ
jgi:hypothetical protein